MQNLQAMLSRLHCSCWGPEGAFLHSCKNSPKLKMVTEKATASVRQVPKCVSKILVRWSRKSEAHAVLTSILLANASIFFLCPGFLFCLFIFFFSFLFIYLFFFCLFGFFVFCFILAANYDFWKKKLFWLRPQRSTIGLLIPDSVHALHFVVSNCIFAGFRPRWPSVVRGLQSGSGRRQPAARGVGAVPSRHKSEHFWSVCWKSKEGQTKKACRKIQEHRCLGRAALS